MKTISYIPFVDDDQNIVLRTDTILTPEEFLQRNTAVFNFANSMKAGAGLPQKREALSDDIERVDLVRYT